ncbi:MAG: glycine cleavage system protein GcvH [Rikenellaceae bacterium]|jgi:glycine cleavage system H protein|nr:glycine cleavage system protein GcvH [Rikenellaceae bacterium]
MNIPQELKYTKDHEWVRVEGNIATVGITDFAQSQLGDIVFVDVVALDKVAQHDVFGTIEAVKTVSDMFCPVGGTIIEFNTALDDEPDAVNSDPYGRGWIVRVQMTDPAELDSLLSVDEYAELIG